MSQRVLVLTLALVLGVGVVGLTHHAGLAGRRAAERTRSAAYDDDYDLFEFGVEHAILGMRDDPDEWPPRYTSWVFGRQG